MSNERVTYAELNVAKHPRKQQRKPRGTRSSISATEQEITYAEFSFQNACQEHPPVCRDRCCKDPEANSQNSSSFLLHLNNNLSSAHTCSHCPKEWISYAHNCYYIGAEKKTWNDSVESCVSKNSNLLHIDSEEEQEFLKLFSLVSWTGVFRESRNQLWIWKKDSTFKPKITEPSQDEHNCVMLSSSGFTADNCTALHAYLCKHKLTN
uniref:Killer cell lectin-like receptor subfamily C, member 1 n=1 Tax=Cricetulus griseus TaxID=10029 RepID=A0A8C2QM35_CRIGR